MSVTLIALLSGVVFGWTLSWARLTDPAVIRDMLLLRDAHVFLIMGSAITVATVSSRLLRAFGARSFITKERIAWPTVSVERRHIVGSVLFGIGWSLTATCPGPVAAMIGEGKLAGLAVAVGIFAGVAIQPLLAVRVDKERPADCAAAGL